MVAGLWIRLKKQTDRTILNKKELDEIVAKLKTAELEVLIDEILKDYLYQDLNDEQDPELQNHIRFVQMVEPYLMLKHGVK